MYFLRLTGLGHPVRASIQRDLEVNAESQLKTKIPHPVDICASGASLLCHVAWNSEIVNQTEPDENSRLEFALKHSLLSKTIPIIGNISERQ
jgi:hypothetical protein